MRVVNGSDLFCLFNAVVEESEVVNTREVLRRTRKFENPILQNTSKVGARVPPPPPPAPHSIDEPKFSASTIEHDSDDDEDNGDAINIEEIYKP
jgi:hypothetical protein